MNLKFPQPQAEFGAVLAQAATQHGNEHFVELQKTMVAPPEFRAAASDQQVKPHQAYTIPLEALLKDSPLEYARPIGWRAIGLSPTGAIVTRTIDYHPTTRKPAVLEINAGHFGVETIKAFTALLKDPHPGDFDFRLLVLPQIYTVAVWLHGTASNDLLIPLAPTALPVKVQQSYPAKEFFARAMPQVKRALESDPTLPPGA